MKLDEVRQLLEQGIERLQAEQTPLDHMLFCGARELTRELFGYVKQQERLDRRFMTGATSWRPGDLAAILTNLKRGSILCIDEIHLLDPSLVPVLCIAMQDSVLDMVIGKEPNQKRVRLKLPRFTVLATTTRPTLVAYPLHTCFPVEYEIEP